MSDALNKLRDPRYVRRRLPWIVLSLLLGGVAVVGAIVQPPAPNPFEPIGDSFLERLRYPIERNPHLRLPSISGYLTSLTFAADGQNGWAVGAGGMILKTVNGGETWAPTRKRHVAEPPIGDLHG